jgi:hypothetical protein
MYKSVVMHDIPMNSVAAMERWYWREHAPEINRRFGPWLVRHESFLPVDAPADARAYGFFNWRVTEGCWREMPAPGARGNLAFTVPPVWPRVATGFFPAQPTEDFCGGGIQPHERNVLRWYCLHRYPEGVAQADGEQWFLRVHAPELVRAGGPYRIFSTRAHREHLPLPGEWPSGARPPMSSLLLHWDRLTEFWFETFDQWREWITDVAPTLTAPPWQQGGRFPFARLGEEFVSSFLLERPSDEFSRDARGYL